MPKIDPTDPIVRATRAERARLVGLLADAGAQDWAHPSLCEGWRVREVVAHITMAYRTSTVGFLAGMVRHGFSFNRFADRAARADTRRMSDADLLECLRANVDHPWQPPGGGALGALSHDVIHGLDITEPLELPPAPPEVIALVLQDTKPKNVAYFGVDLTGLRLVATDAKVSVGEGEPVALPVKDVLLVVTGRHPVPRPTS